jgi:hypothetical protein
MRRRHWKLVIVLVLVGVMVCVAASAQKGKKAKQLAAAKAGEAERTVTAAEVPAAALAALKKLAAGAEITEFAEEMEHGSTFYEGSWKSPSGANMDVLVTPTGDLVEIEEEVSGDKVPAAVLKAAKKAAGRGAELAFEKKTMILYEAKFQKAKKQRELLLTPDGRRFEEKANKGKTEDEEGDDEDDEKDDQE